MSRHPHHPGGGHPRGGPFGHPGGGRGGYSHSMQGPYDLPEDYGDDDDGFMDGEEMMGGPPPGAHSGRGQGSRRPPQQGGYRGGAPHRREDYGPWHRAFWSVMGGEFACHESGEHHEGSHCDEKKGRELMVLARGNGYHGPQDPSAIGEFMMPYSEELRDSMVRQSAEMGVEMEIPRGRAPGGVLPKIRWWDMRDGEEMDLYEDNMRNRHGGGHPGGRRGGGDPYGRGRGMGMDYGDGY